MKKILIIVSGIIVILIIVGIWAYLFVFGKPTDGNGGIFSNFGFGGDEPVITDSTPSIVDTSPVDQSGAPQRLRQLTTRPVAGAVFIDGGIRYVERGTGHMYDIMFSSGQETQVSSFTIARVVDANFSEDGNRVALTTESLVGTNVYIGSLTKGDDGSQEISGTYLPEGAREVAFSKDGMDVYYLSDSTTGSSGYAYTVGEETSDLIFTVPFRDIHVVWSNNVYVYTTPSANDIGYVYEIKNGALRAAAPGAKGLMVTPYDGGWVTSESYNGGILSTAYEDGVEYILPVSLFPEKCVDDPKATSTILCVIPGNLQGSFPDDWYTGKTALVDVLVTVDVLDSKADLISNFYLETGRNIDVARIGADENGRYLYFINKNDDTLWMYDMTL